MPNQTISFAGSIPENYDRYLGPYIFDPFAEDLVARIAALDSRPDHAGPQNVLDSRMQNVLEIACGTGRVTAHLRNALPAARLVATDFNPDMITIARERLSSRKSPDDPADNRTQNNIEWKVADAQALPFGENSFDLLVFQFGLMFVPDKPLALHEACRVLKPGGHLLFNTWDKLENNPSFCIADRLAARYFPNEPPRFFHVPFSLFDDNQLIGWAKDAGFSSVGVHLVAMPCQAPSAEAVATGMLEGTPMFTAINERDPALLPAMKAELTEELAREFGAAPLVNPMQAWVVTATK